MRMRHPLRTYFEIVGPIEAVAGILDADLNGPALRFKGQFGEFVAVFRNGEPALDLLLPPIFGDEFGLLS